MARRQQKKKSSHVLVLLVIGIAVLIVLLLGKRLLRVRRIQVSGDYSVSDREIIDRSGLWSGQSMFSVDPEKVGASFRNDGYLALEKVEVCWPDTVELTVRERKAYACISYLGSLFLIDESCVVMEKLGEVPSDSLPRVTGMNVLGYAVGQTIRSGVPGQVETVQCVLHALEQNGAMDLLYELNVADRDDLYLITRGGMLVRLGDQSGMGDKVLWMKSVLAQLAAEGILKGSLDVSSGKSAIYAP